MASTDVNVGFPPTSDVLPVFVARDARLLAALGPDAVDKARVLFDSEFLVFE